MKLIQIIVLSIVLSAFAGCKKSSDNASNNNGGNTSNDVRVTTYTPQDITSNSAKCGGDAIVTQGLSLSEIGVCWSTDETPIASDINHLCTDVWNEPFVCTITNLEPETKYYVRAYALRGLEYYYGNTKSFTTTAVNVPYVITQTYYSIHGTSVVCEGNVVSSGGAYVTAKGMCWGTNHNPTINDSHTIDGSGLGLFTSQINDLQTNVVYYIRAYAINGSGVGYGEEISVVVSCTQSFTLGETSYTIDNAITIENIQYNGSQVYNAVVLTHGQMIDDNGDENKSVIIVFRGNALSGAYNLSFNPHQPLANSPMYFFAELDVEDIVNFNIDDLLAKDDVYVASSGSFTLETDGNLFTFETDGIEVEQVKDPAVIETSSVDFMGDVARFIYSIVEDGNYNGTYIVTAGWTKYQIMFVQINIIAFITEAGDMVGYTTTASFNNGIPEGTYAISNTNQFIYVEKMNIKNPKFASGGEMTVTRDGDIYTIEMTGLVFDGIVGTSALHYVGTMPYFDYPFGTNY